MVVGALAALAAFVPKQSVRRAQLPTQASNIVLAVQTGHPEQAISATTSANVADADMPSEWQIQEEWALVDDIPRFTVGHSEHRVTFWNALSNTPVLRQRTPEELRARAASLVEHAVGREPKVLRSAHRQADGSWAGTIDGHHRIVHAASEGRSASGAGFVESLTGEIFEVEPELSSSGESGPTAWTQAGSAALAAVRARSTFSLETAYLAALAACWLLIGGQLVALGVHRAMPADVRASWQQQRVVEARSDVLELERWLEMRREAFELDQDTFLRKMEVLEPRLRASETRLAELKAGRDETVAR